MNILVVGAGAVGGYFAGRLLEADRDVTILVRPRRAAELDKFGLHIVSIAGDVHLPSPRTVSSDTLDRPFDLVLLSCKAYDLESAMNSFAKAVGPSTTILPLLNGIRHLDALGQRFGREHVLGGQCLLSSTLVAEGRIVHLNDSHNLTFGEQDGAISDRVKAITSLLSGARFDSRPSTTIVQDMWEKWIFIASLAAISSLMRGNIGDIVAGGADALGVELLDECCAIAAHAGFVPRPDFLTRTRPMFRVSGSPLAASMLRDIERGAPVEADHILGDLLSRADASHQGRSLLAIALAHVKTYETSRERKNLSQILASDCAGERRH